MGKKRRWLSGTVQEAYPEPHGSFHCHGDDGVILKGSQLEEWTLVRDEGCVF